MTSARPAVPKVQHHSENRQPVVENPASEGFVRTSTRYCFLPVGQDVGLGYLCHNDSMRHKAFGMM